VNSSITSRAKFSFGLPRRLLARIEIDHHRRILGHRMQQYIEAPQRMAAQQAVLLQHQPGAFHLLHAGDEMVVPEQRHAFAQLLGRALRRKQGIDPPAAQGDAGPALQLATFLVGKLVNPSRRNIVGEFGRNRGRRFTRRFAEQRATAASRVRPE
jgi:hypothetical protein